MVDRGTCASRRASRPGVLARYGDLQTRSRPERGRWVSCPRDSPAVTWAERAAASRPPESGSKVPPGAALFVVIRVSLGEPAPRLAEFPYRQSTLRSRRAPRHVSRPWRVPRSSGGAAAASEESTAPQRRLSPSQVEAVPLSGSPKGGRARRGRRERPCGVIHSNGAMRATSGLFNHARRSPGVLHRPRHQAPGDSATG